VNSVTYFFAFVIPRVLQSPTPTPSPSVINHQGTQGSNDVLVGAVIGAVATVLAELIARIVGNYRSYRFILILLREEVAEIMSQVNERKSHLDVMIPLYGPFPTRAWETLLQAQQRRYMRKKRRAALSSLYQAVSVANDYVSLIPAALQISQLAKDEQVRDSYRDETIRLLRYPLEAIEAALPKVCETFKIANITVTASIAISGGEA
jgi:hypothetical protein